MGLKYRKILEVRISIETIEKVLEEIRKYLIIGIKNYELRIKNKINPLVIYTPNPEIIAYAQRDEMFKKIVNSAQINIPDGSGVIWAIARKFGIEIKQIAGVNLMKNICGLADGMGFRIGLIGGKEGLAVECAERLLNSYKNLKIEVLGQPEVELRNTNYDLRFKNIHNSLIINHKSKEEDKFYTEKYFQDLANQIFKRKIDILFVALGHPKQEYFIERIKSRLSGIPQAAGNNRPIVMMAVGGSFDYIAGRVKRAPLWMRERGIEWLFRLVQEPWRIRRQILGGEFFFRLLTER